ncbi:ATP-binding cassette domain-containing protein [Amycolatopsis benzoatilytica]|uniref:ATP-binding cassette domain-containing protein n=1 Tax=Amycolatopsis benzoatilytica TaxID=346045 RepID=UPI0012B68BC3|nr:ATP-binding cassette domain-containing protein [Amycolatopsis benzoatilytica]
MTVRMRLGRRLDGAAPGQRLPLPAESGLRQLFRSGLAGTGGELCAMLASATAVAVVSLATPVLIGHVLSQLADGELDGLSWTSALYLVSALAAALLTVVANLRTLRFEDRLETGVQLALWDRLLRLPATFFARENSGALANKLIGISFARQAIDGLITATMLAVLTVVAGIGFLLVLGSPLIWLAVALVLGTSSAGIGLGFLVARRLRAALPAEHRAAAVTHETIHGIAKIKLAAAEQRAFDRWSRATVAARVERLHVGRMQAVLTALSVALPIAGPFVLLLAVRVPATDFFTLNAAFAMLAQSMTTLLSAAVEFVAVLPRLDGISEILAEPTESDEGRIQPPALRGDLELRGVTFGYPGTESVAVKGVSLRIAAGRFVAIVGPSGSGKSTLLRLLLGFEQPQAGSVRYDGLDLARLDRQAVRRQCGVVLQDGQLFDGTVRSNICGAQPLPLEQVWEAARLAGIEEDIRRMPMGMNSLVPYGGGTLSVGQRQRVLIARALAAKPRVLFFDEATSALDNRAQAVVTDSTRALAVTRVVIAHRLSTVRDADQIVVMDHGRVAQCGSFDELLAEEGGLFRRLAQRQLLEPAVRTR